MKTGLILVPGLFVLSCSTPEPGAAPTDLSIRVDLDSTYNDAGHGFLILYPLSEMEDSVHSKITFPDLAEISDTTFSQIYFTGTNHGAVENGVLVLIGNHSDETPLFWVDYNNDLDFSDAKEPVPFAGDFIEISIPDIEKTGLAHTIRFHKPDSTEKPAIREMLETYVLQGENYTDFYFDERRNIQVGDFVYKQDSLRIGLMDWNVNGSYSDLGTDRIVMGAYGDRISGTEEAAGAVVLDSTTYFQGQTYAFEVLEVPANGLFILIKPTLTDNITDEIVAGEAIPDFSFELYPGEKTSIHKQLNGQTYLYLSFWASWCSGCHHEVKDLKKIHAGYSDKFTIVSLNYNEGAEEIKSFLAQHEITWLNGYSTDEINEKLLIEGLPRNILIDPSGKIVEMNIFPSELLSRVDEF